MKISSEFTLAGQRLMINLFLMILSKKIKFRYLHFKWKMQRHTLLDSPLFLDRPHFVHAAPSGYISLFETKVRPVSHSKTYNLFFQLKNVCQ